MSFDAGSVHATLGTEIDERGFRKFDAELNRIEKSGAAASLGAKVEQLGFREFDAAVKRADRLSATADLKADVDSRGFTEFSSRTRTAGRDSDSLRHKITGLNQAGGLLQKTFALIKWPAIIAGLGGAAQGAAALAGGATALVSALAPLTGALVAYPAILGTFAQGMGVIALAGVNNVTTAVGGLNEKLDKSSTAFKALSPQGQKFAVTLDRLKGPLKEIQADVQKPLFAGFNDGLKAAMGSLGPFRKGMEQTAGVIGGLAKRFGELVGSKGFGKDLGTIMEGNAGLMEHLGNAGINVADALRHVMVAAQPLIRWLGRLIEGWSESADAAAKAGENSGRLADFFDKTRATMERVISIAGHLVGAFMNIGKAAAPLGNEILKAIDDAAESFERWTNSAEGRNSLADYFTDIKGPLFEAGRLLHDVTTSFFDLAHTPGLEDLIRQIRTQLLPAFVELTETTTKAFGPVLIDALTEGGKLLGTFIGSSGPLTAFVRLFATAAKALNELIDRVPVLGQVLVTALGGLSIAKLLGIGGISKAISTEVAGGVAMSTTGAAAASARSRFAAFGKRILGGALALGVLNGLGTALSARDVPGMSGFEEKLHDGIGGFFETFGIDLGKSTAEAFATEFRTNITGALKGGASADSPALFGGFEGMEQGLLSRSAAAHAARSTTDTLHAEFRRVTAEENFSDVWDQLTPDERHMARQITDAMNEANRLAVREGISIPSRMLRANPEEIAAALKEFHSATEKLRSDALTSLRDIQSVSSKAEAQIAGALGRGSKQGRELLAANFRNAAEAIQRGMDDGTISVKRGTEEMRRLIEKARLADPTEKQAQAFGRAWGKGLGEAKKVTREGIDAMIANIKKLPEPMQAEAREAMLGVLHELRRNGAISKDEMDKIQSSLVAALGPVRHKVPDVVRDALQLAQRAIENTRDPIAHAAQSAGNAIVLGFQNARDALDAVVSDIAASVGDAIAAMARLDNASAGHGGGPSRGAHGGLVTDRGLRGYALGGPVVGGRRAVAGMDSVLARLMPGEYVMKKAAVSALGAPMLGALNNLSPGLGGAQSLPPAVLQAFGAMIAGTGNTTRVPGRLQGAATTMSTGQAPPRLTTPPPPVHATATSAGSSAGAGSARGGSQPRQQAAGAGGPRGGGGSQPKPGSAFGEQIQAVLDAGTVDDSLDEGERLRAELTDLMAEIADMSAEQAEELHKRVVAQFGELEDDSNEVTVHLKKKLGDRWREIRDTTIDYAGDTRTHVRDEWQQLGDSTGKATEELRKKVGDRFSEIKTTAIEKSKDARSGVNEAFDAIPGHVGEQLTDADGKVKSGLEAIGRTASQKAPAATSPIKTAFTNAKNAAVTALTTINQKVNELEAAAKRAEEAAQRVRNARDSIGGGGGGKAMGGPVVGKGQGDVVPIMAEPGEWVVKKSIVSRLGEGFFEGLDRLGFAMGGKVPKKPKPKPGGHGHGHGHGGKNKPPKDEPTNAFLNALGLVLTDDQLAAFGPPDEYAGFQAADVGGILDPLTDAYLGTGQTAGPVSDLWVGAFGGVGTLFDALFSGIGSNDQGAAAAAEANIFGAGGQGILGAAISQLAGIGSTASGLLGAANPNDPTSAVSQAISGIWSQYDATSSAANAALGQTYGGIGAVAAASMKPTATEAFAIKNKQKRIKALKQKKGPLTKKEKAEIAKLRGEIKTIKAGFGDYTDAESELISNLATQAGAIPGLIADSLTGAGSAVADSLSQAQQQTEGVQGAMEAFGATDPERARADYLAALDAGFGEVENFQGARASLMKDFGSNFLGAGGAAAQGGARTFGAEGETAAGASASSGSEGPVTVNNYFQQPPPDPHTWSRSTLFELRAAL